MKHLLVRLLHLIKPVIDWLGGHLRQLALATMIANVVLIVTGGAVRLTDSGLGCPTWPKCTDGSYTTTSAMGVHGVIEFSNRMLTFGLTVLAIACVLAALAERPRSSWRLRLAWAGFAGIPAQAVLGGISVRTHLNPWVVGCHFLLSIGLVALGWALWRRTIEGDGPVRPLAPAPLHRLAQVLVAASAAVIAAGTIVTGSGPHAGDAHSKRNGLDPEQAAQAHADLVFLVIGLTIALWFALMATGAPAKPTRTLLIIELAQGVIGFVQYFTHLPVALVAAHMLGACVLWIGTLAVLWSLREREAITQTQPSTPLLEPAAVA